MNNIPVYGSPNFYEALDIMEKEALDLLEALGGKECRKISRPDVLKNPTSGYYCIPGYRTYTIYKKPKNGYLYSSAIVKIRKFRLISFRCPLRESIREMNERRELTSLPLTPALLKDIDKNLEDN